LFVNFSLNFSFHLFFFFQFLFRFRFKITNIAWERYKFKNLTEIEKKDEKDSWLSWKIEKGILEEGDTVIARFKTKYGRGLAIDTEERCAKLGRFVIRDGSKILGAGLVLETTKLREDPVKK